MTVPYSFNISSIFESLSLAYGSVSISNPISEVIGANLDITSVGFPLIKVS